MAIPQLKQKDRLLELKTPLAPDALVINGLSGSEALSSLFCFRMELLGNGASESDALNLRGKPFTVRMRSSQGVRYFHGIVRQMVAKRGGSNGRNFRQFHAEVVPWLWLLTQRAGCRIFQDLTVPEILKKIFGEYKSAFSDVVKYEDATTGGKHLPLDYCVQYRETDFNFVSRLMEQEGIFYYFEHDDQGHKLIFTDSTTLLPHVSGKSEILFQPEQGYGDREDVVSEWEHQWSVHPSKYTLRDHHFELPGDTLEVSDQSEGGLLEIYDYPGDYTARFNKPGERLTKIKDEGQKLASLRYSEEHHGGYGYGGSSTCRSFCAGHFFKIHDPNDKYGMGNILLLSVNFSAAQSPDYISGAEATHQPYHNSFTCFLMDPGLAQRFRVRRLTPKPIIAGPQTATVVVKSGEESWLDKFGRVRVQFHWDREGKNDENSACWVRVAQPWAGAGWGAHFWPRVGQEVVVEFLEGDPDRPIITGSVYNPANMPPYKLPDNYTRSGIITRSSKNGATKNFNEIRFEDKKDHEQLFMNAERDMDQRVEHDMREFVGNNQHLIVKACQTQAIGGDKHEHVGAAHVEKIDGDTSRNVKGKHLEKIGNDCSIDVEGDRKEKVGGKLSLQTSNHHEKVQQAYALEAGQEIHIKSGMKLIIESGMQLSLKGPGGFVDIGPTGVTIQGAMVLINSGGSAGSGSGASPDPPDAPKDPNAPQTADDGSKGGAL